MNNKTLKPVYYFALSAFLLMGTGCGGVEQRQQKYLERANEHYSEENYDKARIEIKNVLQINPKNVEAKLLMAKIYKEEEEFRRSFALYNGILEEEPNNVEARLEVAKIYFAGRRDQTALENIDVVLEQDPQNKDAQLLIAAIDSRRGLTDKAISNAEAILKNHPNEPGAIAIIASALIEESPEQALAQLNKGISSNPDDLMLKKLKLQVLGTFQDTAGIEALLKDIINSNPELVDYSFQLASGLATQDKIDEAQSVLLQAINNNPENLSAKAAYIELLIREKGPEKAEKELIKFVNNQPENFDLKNLLAQFYWAQKDLKQARGVYNDVLRSNDKGSESIQARYQLAQLALSDENRESAERYLEQIFALEPNNTSALILRAKLDLADGKNKDAIANLRAALKNDKESVEALQLLAQAQQREKAYRLALDAYRQILTLEPTDKGALFGAANTSLALNEIKQAQSLLESLLKLDPDNLPAVTALMRIYGNQGQWANAETTVAPLLDTEATKTAGLVLQGDIERGREKWDKARALYRQALDRSPGMLEAVGGYTDSFLAKKDFEGAKSFLSTHLEANPELDYAKEMLAKVYELDQDPESAIKIYKELIESAPERTSTVHKLARLYLKQNQLSPAEQLLKSGIMQNPNDMDLKLILAHVYEIKGDKSECMDLYSDILAENPDHTIARNNLAVLLVNHFPNQENLNKALELATPLAESGAPVYLDTLGWVHYKNGNYPQAISYLQAAVKQQPEIDEFRYHLGMAYFKSGNLSNAKSELTLALRESQQNYFGRDEAQKILESI